MFQNIVKLKKMKSVFMETRTSFFLRADQSKLRADQRIQKWVCQG